MAPESFVRQSFGHGIGDVVARPDTSSVECRRIDPSNVWNRIARRRRFSCVWCSARTGHTNQVKAIFFLDADKILSSNANHDRSKVASEIFIATRILSAQHEHSAHRCRGFGCSETTCNDPCVGKWPRNHAASCLSRKLSAQRLSTGLYILPRHFNRWQFGRIADRCTQGERSKSIEKGQNLFGTMFESSSDHIEKGELVTEIFPWISRSSFEIISDHKYRR